MSEKSSVQRKRGNRLGFWFFHMAARVFGLRGAYGLLYFVCMHYLLFDRALVRATLAYVGRRFPEHGPARRLWDAYLLFVNQGKSLVDRYAVAAGYDGIKVDLIGYETMLALGEGGKGYIILTAHVGNWQVAMASLAGLHKTVYLMMRPEDNAAVKNAMNIDSDEGCLRVISTDDPLNSVLEAMKAIQNGQIVSIMGDRPYGFSARETTFMGEPVRFPYGTFSLAAAAQCPVVVLLSAKTGANRYLVRVARIIQPPGGRRARKEQEISAALREYAATLEEYVAEHPLQWFAFRDIWTSND